MNKQGFATNIILIAVIVVLAGVVVYFVLPKQTEVPPPVPGTIIQPPVTPPPATTITPPASILDRVIGRIGTVRLYYDTNLVELPSNRIIRSLTAGTDIEIWGQLTLGSKIYLQSKYSFNRRIPNFFLESATLPSRPAPTVGINNFAASYTTYGQHLSPQYQISYEFTYPFPDFTVETGYNDRPPITLKESNGKIHTINIGINLEAFGGPFRDYLDGLLNHPQVCPGCIEIQSTINIPNATEVYTFANNEEELIGFSSQETGLVIAELKKPTDKAKRVLETLSVTTTIVR